MDVRCPRCQAEYELDDHRVTDEGVTVKCSECQHIFRVKKKSLVMTLPVREDAAIAPSELTPHPPREWRVRQPNGNTYLCRELTTLQKWIVENKVSRNDEISLTGESWKRLGDIPELASFFQVAEDAARVRAMDVARASVPVEPVPLGQPTSGPSGAWSAPSFGTPKQSSSSGQTPISQPIQVQAPVANPNPSHAQNSGMRSAPLEVPDDDQDVQRAAMRGGGFKWLVLVFGGLALGAGAGYYFAFYEPAQREKAEAERKAAEERQAEEENRAKAEEEARVAQAKLEAERRAQVVDAGAAVDAGGPAVAVDAGALTEPKRPEVDAGAAPITAAADGGAPKGSGAREPPVGKSYDYYLERADALRDAEKPQASLSWYGRAADVKPDAVEPLVGRGFALFDLGHLLQSEASFEQALKVNSRYGPAIMGMAEVLKAQGKKAEAIKYYQRYLDEQPNGSEANVAKNAIERLKESN